ncbi:hypothetical protein ANAEL_05675 [Anaerolineales bacterium]|nr:hypothetical protein ANAEL_05675 [Anaerolineales bacterium]
MHTTHDLQATFSAGFYKWLFVTMSSVAVGCFLTFLSGFRFQWSDSVIAVVLSFTTTLFSFLAQAVIIRSEVGTRFARCLPWLLASSLVGWTVSILLVYPLLQLGDMSIDSENLPFAALIGFLDGGAIGFAPGLSIGFVYWWLMRTDYNAKRLYVSTVIAWCLGMGFASATMLTLVAIAVSRLIPIF